MNLKMDPEIRLSNDTEVHDFIVRQLPEFVGWSAHQWINSEEYILDPDRQAYLGVSLGAAAKGLLPGKVDLSKDYPNAKAKHLHNKINKDKIISFMVPITTNAYVGS